MAERGGAEAVARDPNAQRAIETAMDASDAALSASVRAAREEIRAVGSGVHEAVSATHDVLHQSMSDHSGRLNVMTQSMEAMQRQSELQRLQNEILMRQVTELRSMLSDVKVSQHPVRHGVPTCKRARVHACASDRIFHSFRLNPVQ